MFSVQQLHGLPPMEQDGVLPLSHWHWLGVPLDHENAVEPVDKSNSLALTTWIVDQLRKSDKQDVRDFIEGEKDLKRLIELKEIRENGSKIWPNVELTRQQRMSAFAAFLTLDRVNADSCQQCQNRRSKGPCKECISGGPEVFNSACYNCQFSSTATNCSFYTGKKRGQNKGRKRVRSNVSDDEGVVPFDRVLESLVEYTTRDLERVGNWIKGELEFRESSYTAGRRRRQSSSS